MEGSERDIQDAEHEVWDWKCVFGLDLVGAITYVLHWPRHIARHIKILLYRLRNIRYEIRIVLWHETSSIIYTINLA